MPLTLVARRQQHIEEPHMLVLKFEAMLRLLLDRYDRLGAWAAPASSSMLIAITRMKASI